MAIQEPILSNQNYNSDPPGKIKLIKALKQLLNEKDFNSITTAEIARTADTNEALIYWHFQDKRGLLHQVLEQYLLEHKVWMDAELKKVKGAVKKLEKLIWLSLDIWNKNRIYAKILLIEVRSYPGYFESESYMIVRNYSSLFREIINEGIESGEIRNDIDSDFIRNVILGAIEHSILPAIIFGRQISSQKCTDDLSKVFLEGILK